jgi:hypothetical protein
MAARRKTKRIAKSGVSQKGSPPQKTQGAQKKARGS